MAKKKVAKKKLAKKSVKSVNALELERQALNATADAMEKMAGQLIELAEPLRRFVKKGSRK